MSNKRWDWLEGVRPQTPIQWAVTQMAKILSQELSSWPPDIDWADLATKKRYEDLFAADARAPSHAAFDQAIIRAVWDLTRDHEALEHYQRNNQLEQACSEPYDRLASIFIETYLTEAVFELIERTNNRVKRRDAISCLEQLSALQRHTRN